MDKTHTYRGHAIILNADESADGWVGAYSVCSSECQDTHSNSDSLPGNFTTEEKADQAALEAAKQWIDFVHKT
jgi:hypothetical protein